MLAIFNNMMLKFKIWGKLQETYIFNFTSLANREHRQYLQYKEQKCICIGFKLE